MSRRESLQKQSSFARSFFKDDDVEEKMKEETGTAATTTAADNAADGKQPSYPMPKSRPASLVKRRSSRLLSTGRTRQSLEDAQKAQREIAEKLAGLVVDDDHDDDDDDRSTNSFGKANSFTMTSPTVENSNTTTTKQTPSLSPSSPPSHHQDGGEGSLRGTATEPYDTSIQNLHESNNSLEVLAITPQQKKEHQHQEEGGGGGSRQRRPVPEKQNSWYQDALAQGGNEALDSLKDLLGNDAVDFVESPSAAAAAAASPLHNINHNTTTTTTTINDSHTSSAGGAAGAAAGWDDDEVLEQYRLMAQHEATLRVKENTGFDFQEYEKRKEKQVSKSVETQFQQEAGKGLYYTGQVKLTHHLPFPKRCLGLNNTTNNTEPPKPMEPPPPPYKPRKPLLVQKTKRVPDLCTGKVVVEGEEPPHETHVVQCLGCREALQVHRYATLMSCPKCQTVSPASSTRH
mmetsp:Transcript_18942/g.29181  ORF Transcript_18942/g.29181 Transcript_18942/m.29181 type:complete len:459 (+) Transcript_18942:165-1541(+)